MKNEDRKGEQIKVSVAGDASAISEIGQFLQGLFPNLSLPASRGAANGEILAPGIMLFREAISDPQSVLETLLSKLTWQRSRVASAGQVVCEATPRLSESADLVASSEIDDPVHVIRQAQIMCLMGYAKVYKDLACSMEPFQSHLIRYLPGGYFERHVDAVAGHPEMRRRVVSVLTYLDDNFQGGETVFPTIGLSVRPIAGSVLMFPSNFMFPHESAPLAGGAKHTAVAWFLDS